MQKSIKTGWWLWVVFLFSIQPMSLATAAGDDYPSKTIQWIVPASPGGGFDTYARVLAPELQKYLPHNVNVVIKNISGGGGLKGAGTLFNSKPDGYTIGYVMFPGIAIIAMTSDIGFDYNKFTSIAEIAIDEQGIFVPAKSDIKTLADLQKRDPLRILTRPKGVSMYSFWQITTNILNLKPKLITGYKGGNEIATGLMRGDGEAAILNLSQFIKYEKSGDLRVILTFSEKRDPITPDVPSVAELGYPENTAVKGWKIIYGPPGLPADITKTLETAFQKALEDPEVKAWSKKAGKAFRFLDGKASWEVMQKVIATYKKYD